MLKIMIGALLALIVCAVLTSAGYTAAAVAGAPRSIASPARFCSRIVTDDVLRPIPGSLVPAAERAFGLAAMPARMIRESTFFRCFERRILLCTVGANLPCGKADTRISIPAADEWCVTHRGAGSIPAFVVGHATVYDWKCDGTKAAAAGAVLHVDRRGFVAEYWKAAE
jgi:hypothetical protein